MKEKQTMTKPEAVEMKGKINGRTVLMLHDMLEGQQAV